MTTLAELIRPIPSVHESVTADRVLKDLRERRSHQALVVDESGGTAGLLTLADVLTELFGHVGDEFRSGQLATETLPDGRIRLPGEMGVDDAAMLLETTWETDASTVGGLVTEALGHIPAERETVVDRRFRVRGRTGEGSHSAVGRRQARGPRFVGGPAVMEILIPIAIILFLILANGLFVAAEFAIVGAPRSSIEHQASQGSRLAARVLRVLEDPARQDRYIATTQIGISVASLGLGMYGEHWLAGQMQPWFIRFETVGWIAAHTVASVVAVAVLTYLHIVLGEMVPKALALQRADKTVLYVSPIIGTLQRIILPLVVVLNSVGNRLLRLAGIERREVERERYHTAEELEFIVRESQEGGLLRGEAGQILRDLFEFGDRTAGEVMVPRVLLAGIPVGAEPDELRAIVRTHPHTRYPVYSGDLDNIIGSLHIKEILRHLVSNQPVAARDARALPYVPGPAQLDEVTCRDATVSCADGRRHGSTRRYGRPRHDRGSVRRSRRRYRRRAGATTHRA